MSLPAPPYTFIIKPRKGWSYLDIREIWNFRELFYFLAWRDIKIRYKQTLLGVAWAILQPLLLMGIFTLFFGKLAGLPSDGIPYPLFTLSALVLWNFFATGLNQAANSLVGNAHLITKVYFPRIIVPISTLLSGMVDFVISFSLLMLLFGYYGFPVRPTIIYLPLFLLLVFLLSMGAGTCLSALNVKFRDVRHTIPFLTQIWLFMTPVVYPTSLLPEGWRWLYSLNPMVGVVEGFRFSLFGRPSPSLSVWLGCMVMASALALSGIFYFRKMEREFADII